MARILILEDDPNRIYTFVEKLHPQHDVTIVTTAEAAKKALQEGFYNVLFLDNDLGGEQHLQLDMSREDCGYAVAKRLIEPEFIERWNRGVLGMSVIVHTMNPEASAAITSLLQANGYCDVHRIPYSSLKLDGLIQENRG